MFQDLTQSVVFEAGKWVSFGNGMGFGNGTFKIQP
jgi:hypothetical protein